MSTSYYYKCMDHNPPLESEYVAESSSRLSDLFSFVGRNREKYLQLFDLAVDLGVELDYDFELNREMRVFLMAHRNCNITVWDEYGREQESTCTVCRFAKSNSIHDSDEGRAARVVGELVSIERHEFVE